MTIQPSSSQHDTGTFADLIEKYATSSYGEQWATEIAPGVLQRLLDACATKDYNYLRGLCYQENAFIRELFTRHTGIALHRTQRESLRILEAYVGPEKVAAYEQEQATERQQRQLDWLQRQVAYRRVNADNYGMLTVDEFIRRLIADGFTQLSERKRGVASEWFLCNAQHTGYTFRRRVEHDYIQHLLEQDTVAEKEHEDA